MQDAQNHCRNKIIWELHSMLVCVQNLELELELDAGIILATTSHVAFPLLHHPLHNHVPAHNRRRTDHQPPLLALQLPPNKP